MAKATPDEIELHSQIKSGDDLAFSKLCDKYLEPTIEVIRKFNRHIHLIDNSIIPEIVIDSFYAYLYNPDKFNPEKQTLERFLVIDAEGDLKNAWVRRKKHQKLFKAIDDETKFDGQFEHSKSVNLNTPSQALIDKEAEDALIIELKKHFDSEIDIEIANLILSEERETRVYSEILGITHLQTEEQQKEVKRSKDRIKKVLRRKIKGKKI